MKKGATGAVDPEVSGTLLWQLVNEGNIEAAILTLPEPLPMIWFTTISSSLDFVAKHPDIVERFIAEKIVRRGLLFVRVKGSFSAAESACPPHPYVRGLVPKIRLIECGICFAAISRHEALRDNW